MLCFSNLNNNNNNNKFSFVLNNNAYEFNELQNVSQEVCFNVCKSAFFLTDEIKAFKFYSTKFWQNFTNVATP